MAKEKWVQRVTSKNPGSLHRQLDVPEGQKIPAAKMARAASGELGPLAQKRANLAKTLGKLRGR